MELHSRCATRKWCIINDQNNGQYGRGNENDATIKFETKVIKPNLCDYSDAYILVTGDIKVAAVAADTNVAFKNFKLKYDSVLLIFYQFKETYKNSSKINSFGTVTIVTKENTETLYISYIHITPCQSKTNCR